MRTYRNSSEQILTNSYINPLKKAIEQENMEIFSDEEANLKESDEEENYQKISDLNFVNNQNS